MEQKQAQVKIETLSPQELVEIEKQLQNDIQSLRQSHSGMRLAASKFQESKAVVSSLATEVEDKEIMIPLTSSLYVPGKICDREKIIVEAGAGYFIELGLEKGSEYWDRKLDMMNGNAKKIAEMIEVKSTQLQHVNNVIQKKIQEIQANQAQAKA